MLLAVVGDARPHLLGEESGFLCHRCRGSGGCGAGRNGAGAGAGAQGNDRAEPEGNDRGTGPERKGVHEEVLIFCSLVWVRGRRWQKSRKVPRRGELDSNYTISLWA